IAGAAVLPAALAISAAMAPGAGSAAVAGSAAAVFAPNPTRTLPTSPTMRAWGTGNDGELGDGSRTPVSDTPVQVRLPNGVTPTATRAGCQDSVALTTKGTALAWGNDTFGQLGDGTTATARSKPVTVKLPKGAKLTSVRAGCAHDLALTSTGTVLAWGLNGYGQLGDGTTKNRHAPVRVKLPKGAKVTAISTGCYDSLAVTSTGKLYAWGHNQDGQLGDGSKKNRHTPVQVKLPAGAKVTTIAGGCNFSLANTSQGLFAWGDNSEGQLGDGTTTSTTTPVPIIILIRGQPLGSVTGLFGGCDDSMLLFSKGALLASGNNNAGQLGNGTTTSSDKPVGVKLPTGVKVKSIAEGCFHSLALTTTGAVLAWGENSSGQLGTGSTANSDVPVQVDLPPGLVGTAIGSGPAAQHSLAIFAGAG
ncbi:MAG: RCC1 domain-containing protein, partial [Streptosporangiaceae bacterium]